MHTTTAQKPQSQSSAKRALLEKLRQGKLRKKSAEPQGIPRYTDNAPLQLSFAQQRLWFLEQFEGGHPTYNEPFHARLKGPLDIDVLERTLNEIVRRHDTLRSSFKNEEGQPVVEIAPELTLTLTVQDLRKLPVEQREETARQRQQENACRIFDLSECPLFRVELLRIADEEFLLLLTFHHIIYDGWSINVLMHELKTLYEAFSKGRRTPLPELPELPVQYTDFARWQREYMQGKVQENQMAYWREKLKGSNPTLDLPTDFPRPPQQTFEGKQFHFQLPKALSEQLEALSKQEKCTLSMLTLAAFKVLLYRYSGKEDILVGSAVANRTRRETEPMLGMFVNTLVLRTDLSEDPTFLELLQRVRQTLLEAQEHQELPFDVLIEELLPQRDLSHTPFFQVWFNFQNFEIQNFSLGEVNFQQIPFHTGTAKFDLTVHVLDSDEGFHVFIEYNTVLLHETTIQRMAKHFQTLLEEIVKNPAQQIGRLPILTEIEQSQILNAWNDTETDYSSMMCIHELFEAQAKRTPDAIALVFEEQRFTYQELDRQANQLAHYLQKIGLGPEMLVALYMERTPHILIGILGILKAGGAYLPMDRVYPKDRIAFMLEDSHASILLTQKEFLNETPNSGIHIICLDTDWEHISQESQKCPKNMATPENLAYVIYTSGSTGKPKGVQVSHHNVVRLFKATEQWYQFNTHDIWTLFHSYAFDFSVWEIWGALLYGGKLIIVPYWISRSPEAFYDLLSNEQVTVLNQTPSAFRQLIRIEEESPQNLPPLSLRLVIFGGEALDLQSLKPWFERHGDTSPQLVNMYGITETTVHVTYRPIKMADLETEIGSVIGRPIPDLQVYILDSYLQPVPFGVSGEICVGGAGVARGYLNREQLTRERFIPNPFQKDSKTFLYRSGDLARYLSDKEIEYLGRIDHQVQIRGFRIELGEIESALGNHPAIREVVVLPREDISGNTILAAYIASYQGQKIPVGELRDFLNKKLPDYMIPTTFTFLESFPLTPNGKIDIRALPAPEIERQSVSSEYISPRNALEKQLEAIWIETLHIERVGIFDNFFELGGHSLLAMQLMSTLAKTLHVKLSVKDLFLQPTIATLAEKIEQIKKQSFPLAENETACKEDAQEKTPEKISSPLYRFEDRPLLSLYATGQLAPVDSVALDYFTPAVIEKIGMSKEDVIALWCQNVPTIYTVSDSQWGRTAYIMLPFITDELFSRKADLLNSISEAITLSKLLGAQAVTLTGLLAWATDYAREVIGIANQESLPKITTGHGIIASAYTLNVEKILQQSGRQPDQERIAYLDVSSLGLSTLRLILHCLPHPEELLLCDMYNRLEVLEDIRREVVEEFEFKGKIHMMGLHPEIPSELYEATTIICPTNVPDILDINKVKSGTLCIGTSCFNENALIARFETQGDILFTVGGVLQLPEPIDELTYKPRPMAKHLNSAVLEEFNSKGNAREIPGCTLSSLLCARFEQVSPSVGLVKHETALQEYQFLKELGCQGGELHSGNYGLLEESIKNFRERFGYKKKN